MRHWKVNLQFSNSSTIAVADFAHYFVVVVRPKPTKSSDADWHWPSTQHLNATPCTTTTGTLCFSFCLLFAPFATTCFPHIFHGACRRPLSSSAAAIRTLFSPIARVYGCNILALLRCYYSCFTFFCCCFRQSQFVTAAAAANMLPLLCVWLSSLFP